MLVHLRSPTTGSTGIDRRCLYVDIVMHRIAEKSLASRWSRKVVVSTYCPAAATAAAPAAAAAADAAVGAAGLLPLRFVATSHP